MGSQPSLVQPDPTHSSLGRDGQWAVQPRAGGGTVRLTFKVFYLRSETLDLAIFSRSLLRSETLAAKISEMAKVSLRSQSLAANAAPVRSPLPFPIKV